MVSWLTKPKELFDGKLGKNIAHKEHCYSSEIVEEIIRESNLYDIILIISLLIFRYVDDVIKLVGKMIAIFKESKDGNRKRAKSFDMQNNSKEPVLKMNSIKLQDIAKKDFKINESVPRASNTRQKSFIPGVARKQLVSRKSTEHNKTYREEDDICTLKFLFMIFIAVALKETTKPEFMKIGDEEEENEGGSDDNSSTKSNKPKKKSSKHKKKKHKVSTYSNRSSDGLVDESSVILDSDEELKSAINFKVEDQFINPPGQLFSQNKVDKSAIDDIPFSAFESSDSSDSDDTFESYEPDQINQSESENKVEEVDEEHSKEAYNVGEDMMVSLSDIPIEVDQGHSEAQSE